MEGVTLIISTIGTQEEGLIICTCFKTNSERSASSYVAFVYFFLQRKYFLITSYKSKTLFDKLIYINAISERGDKTSWLPFDELVI